MKLRRRKILALLVESSAFVLAEQGGNPPMREARFEFPAETGLEKPHELGEALREFLKRNHFSARDAAIGLPVREALFRHKRVPRSDASALAGIARLEVERGYTADVDALALDYLSTPAPDEQLDLKIIAIHKRTLDQLSEMCRAASLTLVAVTVATALPGCTEPAQLFLLRDRVEMVLREKGTPSAVKHLPSAPCAQAERAAWLAAVAGAARLMLLARSTAGPQTLEVLEDVELTEDEAFSLATALNLQAHHKPDAALNLARDLAATVADGRELTWDFMHSRMQAHVERRFTRKTALAASAAAAVVIGIVVFLYGVWNDQRQVSDLQNRLKALRPQIETASGIVNNATLARGWGDKRPRFLDPLRELTLLVPREDRLWITSIAMRHEAVKASKGEKKTPSLEVRRIAVSGKASDDSTALAFLDRVRKSPAFGDVQSQFFRGTGGSSGDRAFSFTCTYVGKE